MTREIAEQYAREAIFYLNPEYWNGKGEKPARLYIDLSYKIDFGNPNYDIYVVPYYYHSDGWCYRASLVNIKSGEVVNKISCYGIDNIGNLADILEEIVRDCRKELCNFHVTVDLQGDGLYTVGIATHEGGCRRIKEDLTLTEVERLIGDEIHSYAETTEQ